MIDLIIWVHQIFLEIQAIGSVKWGHCLNKWLRINSYVIPFLILSYNQSVLVWMFPTQLFSSLLPLLVFQLVFILIQLYIIEFYHIIYLKILYVFSTSYPWVLFLKLPLFGWLFFRQYFYWLFYLQIWVINPLIYWEFPTFPKAEERVNFSNILASQLMGQLWGPDELLWLQLVSLHISNSLWRLPPQC